MNKLGLIGLTITSVLMSHSALANSAKKFSVTPLQGFKDAPIITVYLESSKETNISFYEKYGFKVVGKCIPVKGCPPEWLMLRPSQ